MGSPHGRPRSRFSRRTLAGGILSYKTKTTLGEGGMIIGGEKKTKKKPAEESRAAGRAQRDQRCPAMWDVVRR